MTDNNNHLRDQYRQAPYVRTPETLDKNILREAAMRANVVNARKADKNYKRQQQHSTMRGLGVAFSCLLCVGLGFLLIREPATEIVMPAPPLADISATTESSQTMATPSLVVVPPTVSNQVNDGAPNATGITAEMSVDSVVTESVTVSARESADNFALSSDLSSAGRANDSTATSAGKERRSEPLASELPIAVTTDADSVEEEIARDELSKVEIGRLASEKNDAERELSRDVKATQVQILEERVVDVQPAQIPPALPVERAPDSDGSSSDLSQPDQSLRQSKSRIPEARIAGSENSVEERADLMVESAEAGVSASNRITAGKSFANRAIELSNAVRLVSVAELSALPQDNYTIIIAESDHFQSLARLVNRAELGNDVPTMQLVNIAGVDNPPRWLLLHGTYESLQMASDGVRSVREIFSLSGDSTIKPRLSIQQYSTLR